MERFQLLMQNGLSRLNDKVINAPLKSIMPMSPLDNIFLVKKQK